MVFGNRYGAQDIASEDTRSMSCLKSIQSRVSNTLNVRGIYVVMSYKNNELHLSRVTFVKQMNLNTNFRAKLRELELLIGCVFKLGLSPNKEDFINNGAKKNFGLLKTEA